MTIFGIPIFPDQASTFAKDVDALYFFILATCAFFAIVVSAAVVFLGIKYHKTHEGQIGARIEGNPPHITTWINGVQIMEWQEKELRHPEKGRIALQVHGGGDHTKEFVRYRNIRVKRLAK